MSPETDCPVLLLASGQTIKMRRVKLYEKDKVNELSLMKASAAKSLGGISTGIGFWGSPAWALGGAAALGIFEGILSSRAQKQGIEILRNVATKSLEIANEAISFDAAKLINSEVPYPQAWSAAATIETTLDVSRLGWRARKDLLKKHGMTERDITRTNDSAIIKVKTNKIFIHDGDEFVNMDTDAGIINIRWSHVVGYFPAKMTLEQKELATGDTRKCPYCAELIKSEAKVCGYCQRELEPVTNPTVLNSPSEKPKARLGY